MFGKVTKTEERTSNTMKAALLSPIKGTINTLVNEQEKYFCQVS
jgi:hypothetical protein